MYIFLLLINLKFFSSYDFTKIKVEKNQVTCCLSFGLLMN